MRTLAILLAASAAAIAQTPEYLPLQVGNQWIYRTAAGPSQVVEVNRLETVGGNSYAVLSGFGAETWLRLAADGVLVSYDRESRTEKPYLNFAAAEGATFPTSGYVCTATETIESKNAKGSYPLGDFTNVLAIRYGLASGCADAGLLNDYYLPYIGLLRRTETTIAGPRTYDLTYARINGTVKISTSATTFSVSTDKSVYLRTTPGAQLNVAARMAIENTDQDALIMEFADGQEIEYILSDSAGKTIRKWSDGRAFNQSLQTLRISKERNWASIIPLAYSDGQPLPAGMYKIDGYINTRGGARYRGQVTIEIAEIRPAN